MCDNNLEMEYKGQRYAGYKISEEEMEYIINDVLVLKEALEYMITSGNKQLTIGSRALKSFKRWIFKNHLNKKCRKEGRHLLCTIQ